MPILSVTLGYVIDLLIGDPLWEYHPVALLGKLIAWLEKLIRPRVNRPACKLAAGLLIVAIVVGLAYGVTSIVGQALFAVNPLLSMAWDAMIIYWTMAIKALIGSGLSVLKALNTGDLDEARHKLSCLVGRDTHDLNVNEVCRGTVESLAENTCDGIIAPLFYAAVGGAPLAMAYRAVNTLDSMMGYRDERYEWFGKAAAKLDDFANLIPARIGSLLMLAGAALLKLDVRAAWKTLVSDGGNHPSPNSGLMEAVASGAVRVRLGGTNKYRGIESRRPVIGSSFPAPGLESIILTARLVKMTSFLGLITAVFLAFLVAA